MECDSPIKKEWVSDTCCNINSFKRKNPDTKYHIFYGFIYLKCPENENLYRWIVVAWGSRWELRVIADGHEESFGVTEML